MPHPLSYRRWAIALSATALAAAPAAATSQAAGSGPHATAAVTFAAKITRAKINPTLHRARFRFKTVGGKAVAFYCALQPDSQVFRFVSCTSPKVIRRLKAGGYTFYVYGVNAKGKHSAGASYAFTI